MATKVLGDGASASTKYWGKMQHGLSGSLVANLIFGDDGDDDDDDEDDDEFVMDREFDSAGSPRRNDSDGSEDEDGGKSLGRLSQGSSQSQDDSILFENSW
jgi:hypothetical protein